ncbi:hypothetical protein DXB98_09305 [Collinsella sp. OM07-12]|jgi:hypothetical protein|uniref:YjcQ family protein n=1 Tax=Collinsella sp. OM07-12 TaxID=2292328 RepID=UPI000E4529B2|nr:YjcQ family protein [Collinsella sp. OM07-12]RGM70765.1 hypothetical protein DXB98_09305 [Collinsella sp. OM07-12]
MAADDFDVVVFKVLSYLYQCIKDGVEPNPAKAQELAKINPVYWRAVVSDLIDRKLVVATVLKTTGETLYYDLRITSAGVDYLNESPKMRKVKEFLGTALDVAIHIAVEATKAL